MKIEYFADSGPETPTVLIYGGEPEGFVLLRDAATSLSDQRAARIAVHELPGFESVEGCQLYFSVSTRDLGVRLVEAPRSFECSVRPVWWYNIEGLLEPLCDGTLSSGSQFLTVGFHSAIKLIVSHEREW